MSLRACCCTDSESAATVCPESLPSPISPCTAPRWKVLCFAYGMKGVQFTTGQITFSDGGCLDCQKGACGLTALHQGSVDYPDAAAEGECVTTETNDETCAKFLAGKSIVPETFGHHILEFTDGGYWEVYPDNVTYEDQSDCVRIEQVTSCGYFQGCETSTDTRLFSTVRVRFEFDISYNGWSLNPTGDGECAWTQYPINVFQTWTCLYQRLLTGTKYLAEGPYRLVKVNAPWVTGANVTGCITGGATCTITVPDTFCAPNYLSPVDYQGVSLPWQPPPTLTVLRTC